MFVQLKSNLSAQVKPGWHIACFLVMVSGFAWYLLGMQLSSSNKFYHQLLYTLFWFPALIYFFSSSDARRLWCTPIPLTVVGTAFFAGLSVFWAGGDGLSLKSIFYVLLALNAALVLSYLGREHTWQVLAACCLVGGYLAWYGVFSYYSINNFSSRVVGPGAIDHTILGSHLMGALGVLLFFLRGKVPEVLTRYCVVWISLLGYVTYIVFSKSKGPLLALLVCFSVYAVITYGWRAIFYMVAMSFCVGLYVVIFPELALRGGFSYRPEAWVESLRIWLSNPLFGIGAGVEYPVYIESMGKPITHAHNFYINYLIQLGVFGLFSWITVLFFVFVFALRFYSSDVGKGLFYLMVFSVFALLTDGKDAWVKPNETWFTVWLPIYMGAMLYVVQSTAKPTGSVSFFGDR